MSEKIRVFFPLRSNIDWYKTSNLQDVICEHIKEAVLIYDEIYIEDGTYELDILEYEGALRRYFPPGTISHDSRKIKSERDFKRGTIKVALGPKNHPPKHLLFEDTIIASFKIDYYDIFKNIDISNFDYIKFVLVDKNRFPNKTKTILREQISIDKHRFRNIHPNTFYRDALIEDLNSDLISSIFLKSAIVLDNSHKGILKRKCKLPHHIVDFLPVKEEIAVREILSIATPDLSNLTMEEVFELREDKSWMSFREFIRTIVSEIRNDPEKLINPNSLHTLIKRNIDQALFNEIERKYVTRKKLALELGMGITSIIPGFGIPSAIAGSANSIHKYLEDKSSWYAFLMKLKRHERCGQ